ncbi:MAG: glycosyltransferase family 4 protein [Leucobacter sp.]
MIERALVVTPWFPSPGHEGAGMFNLRDASLLAKGRELQVLHLIRPDWYDPSRQHEQIDGIPVKRVPFSAASPGSWLAARKALGVGLAQADVLHTMAFPALLPFTGMRVDVPWVHTEHWSGLVSTSVPRSARGALRVFRNNLKKPNEVVAVGQPLATAIDRLRPIPTTVIGNFVRFAPEGRLSSVANLEPGNTLRIMSVGNLVSTKGPIETVEMLASLKAAGIQTTLEWAGTGPLQDAMLARAKELGVGKEVRLLGHLAPDKLTERLLNANLFVLPTQIETFGVAIAEALGHGLLVVTAGAGGHLDFLRPEFSRVVPARTGTALAVAVQDLLSDRSRWQPKEIRDYANSQFSEQHRGAAYAGVYARAKVDKPR